MKKPNLKNIAIINFLIIFLISGNYYTSVYCETECCLAECCEENSAPVDSNLSLFSNDTDCCEFNEAFENKIQTAVFLNINVNASAPTILDYYLPDKYNSKYFLLESPLNLIRQSHSISILRI